MVPHGLALDRVKSRNVSGTQGIKRVNRVCHWRIIINIIKFSTLDNAFRILWLVHSILVISSYTLVWPYMVNDWSKLKMFSPESKIFLWIKLKKKKKLFCGKFGSMLTFKSTRNGKKCFLWWAYVCLTTRCYTTLHFHQVFFHFAQNFMLFSLVFCTPNFWSLRNLIKKLFHSHLLDMRLVIANAGSWNNC